MWCGRWRHPSRAAFPTACRRFWGWKKSARGSNTNSRKSCTTGAPTCARTCWASSTSPRATPAAANGACPTPAATGCCAPSPTSPPPSSPRPWPRPTPSRNWLLRAKADLTPAIIAQALARRLGKLGLPGDIMARIAERIATIDARERALAALTVDTGERTPWFCSGCPHNTSTRVPEGSRAVAGIGCHYMANWMPGRNTATFTQMGGEGVTWVGQQPFSTERHIFANLGDGTYFHSGLLAIRQSIAAGVDITYKLLYNDAVAMTGGQPLGERPEGHSVLQIMNTLKSEGVAELVIVTDEPRKYRSVALAEGVSVHHRDALDSVQRRLRTVAGCTVIIYDQTCATERRRRRKRGLLATPDRTVLINELVCEGCGDCSEQSNCLSVEPVQTAFGRKRRINQSSCNKDFSCINGFCP